MTVAVLFPGQGSHEPAMLDAARRSPSFPNRRKDMAEAAGFDPVEVLEKGKEDEINGNKTSSLLTVLASVVAFDDWKDEGNSFSCCAGYSVGGWAALFAAGVVDYITMTRVVACRADMMDRAIASSPSKMIAILGVRESQLLAVLDELGSKGFNITISNYNCLGNYSLAAEEGAVMPAMEELRKLKPTRLVCLPVAGGWHSGFLDAAAKEFYSWLQEVTLARQNCGVIDNVTGGFLPEDPVALREQMAAQICKPVQWDKGIRTLIKSGAQSFIELGYGNMLTKFGIFIDRTVSHAAYSGHGLE